VLVDAAVELELRVVEREPREERVLGEREVGHRRFLEEVGLLEGFELPTRWKRKKSWVGSA
jgi:hypothetical protein